MSGSSRANVLFPRPLPAKVVGDIPAADNEVYGEEKFRARSRGLGPVISSWFSPRPRPVRDATKTPWRCICHLVMEYPTGDLRSGTGFFIGPRTVATAAHNLFLPEFGRAKDIYVIPARRPASSGSVPDPFGWDLAHVVEYPEEWRRGLSASSWKPFREFDYGAVFLQNDALSRRVGEALDFDALSEEALAEIRDLTVAGYPKMSGDRWELCSDNGGPPGKRLVWEPKLVRYTLNTFVGQSGGPLLFKPNESAPVKCLGIHTMGLSSENIARRIDGQLFETMRRWRNQPPPALTS